MFSNITSVKRKKKLWQRMRRRSKIRHRHSSKFLAISCPLSANSSPNGRTAALSCLAMKAHYYPETESLYIDVEDRPSVDSQEIAPGVIADFDERGNLVGLDIDRSLRKEQFTPEALLRFLDDRMPAVHEPNGEFLRVLREFRTRLESLVGSQK